MGARGNDRRLARCTTCGEWTYAGRCPNEDLHPAMRPAKPRERRADQRPCHRCGITTSHRARPGGLTGVCLDCRHADPLWVRAVREGVPCA